MLQKIIGDDDKFIYRGHIAGATPDTTRAEKDRGRRCERGLQASDHLHGADVGVKQLGKQVRGLEQLLEIRHAGRQPRLRGERARGRGLARRHMMTDCYEFLDTGHRGQCQHLYQESFPPNSFR